MQSTRALDPAAPHLANVVHLARAALVAYNEGYHDSFRVLDELFLTRTEIATDEVSGFVAASDEDALVVFRGSSDDREWTKGISFGQVPFGPGRAHGGFTKLLDTLWDRILAALYDADALSKDLWLAGHSVGGALALLATLRLEETGFEPAMTCTFGAPKVLDPVAAAAIRTPVYRVENSDDAVPHIAWPNLLDTYAHAGTAIRLMPSGRIAEARHGTGLARRLDRVNELFEGPAKSGIIHDHNMLEYLRKLECAN